MHPFSTNSSRNSLLATYNTHIVQDKQKLSKYLKNNKCSLKKYIIQDKQKLQWEEG